jgi:hypothetical protein
MKRKLDHVWRVINDNWTTMRRNYFKGIPTNDGKNLHCETGNVTANMRVVLLLFYDRLLHVENRLQCLIDSSHIDLTSTNIGVVRLS